MTIISKLRQIYIPVVVAAGAAAAVAAEEEEAEGDLVASAKHNQPSHTTQMTKGML